MVGLLATSIVSMIYLTGQINGPFQGSVRVLPTAMEEAVSVIRSSARALASLALLQAATGERGHVHNRSGDCWWLDEAGQVAG
jgi:hypothetical protein